MCAAIKRLQGRMRRALCSKGLLFFIGTNLAPRSSFTAPFFLPSFVSPVCTALQDVSVMLVLCRASLGYHSEGEILVIWSSSQDACRAPLGARGVRAMATSTRESHTL